MTPTPWAVSVGSLSQRFTTSSMAKWSSARTVTSQRSPMKASISVFSSRSSLGVEAHGVARQEQVARVVVDLRPLVRLDGVLDRQCVQPQLVGEPGVFRRKSRVGVEEVDSRRPRLVGQALGHLGDREVLVGQHAVAVRTGAHVTHGHKSEPPWPGSHR